MRLFADRRKGSPAGLKALPEATVNTPSLPPTELPETIGLIGTEPPAPSEVLLPPQGEGEIGRLGHYRVLKVLAAGGMGMVFQAEDVRLGRMCALKTMRPDMAKKPEMKERFLREARAAAQLEHDHIIPIHQVDEDNGVPYIAMPFLKGASLEDWFRHKQKSGCKAPLTEVEILKLGREIARGLAAAHEKGLIHRDIKPANIWLDASAGGRVKILDFGLAQLSEGAGQQHLTQFGAIMGTPSYMAPEQAQGLKLDGRADLFSLGVVLYRLGTGELPFKGNNPMNVLMALASHTPPPVRDLNPAISPALSELVMQLLAKDPVNRVGSAKEVVQRLQAIERGAGSDPNSSPMSFTDWTQLQAIERGARSDPNSSPMSFTDWACLQAIERGAGSDPNSTPMSFTDWTRLQAVERGAGSEGSQLPVPVAPPVPQTVANASPAPAVANPAEAPNNGTQAIFAPHHGTSAERKTHPRPAGKGSRSRSRTIAALLALLVLGASAWLIGNRHPASSTKPQTAATPAKDPGTKELPP
jgi:serine/threonine protein kinase